MLLTCPTIRPIATDTGCRFNFPKTCFKNSLQKYCQNIVPQAASFIHLWHISQSCISPSVFLSFIMSSSINLLSTPLQNKLPNTYRFLFFVFWSLSPSLALLSLSIFTLWSYLCLSFSLSVSFSHSGVFIADIPNNVRVLLKRLVL